MSRHEATGANDVNSVAHGGPILSGFIRWKETAVKKLPAFFIAAGAALAAPAFAETVTVYYDDVPTYYVPATNTVTYVESPIIVTSPYLTEDQAITSEVMEKIYNDSQINGRVGLDTYNNVVTLSGRVGTPWQADRAVRHAQNTPGVREVNTQLMSRIGGG